MLAATSGRPLRGIRWVTAGTWLAMADTLLLGEWGVQPQYRLAGGRLQQPVEEQVR